MKTPGRMGSPSLLGLAWVTITAVSCAVAPGQEKPVAAAETAIFRYGGDIRLREEFTDNLPYPADKQDAFNYIRMRTRLWGEADPGKNVTVRIRLANEFRHYFDPDTSGWSDAKALRFPEELVVDNLSLSFKDLLSGRLDATLGRQDIEYGTGRLIRDATPLDGSRTCYIDAMKLTWKGFKNTTVDLLGVYNTAENSLAINSRERILFDNGADNRGAGIYLKNKSCKKMPFEAYYMFVQEDASSKTASTNSSGAFKPPTYSWQVIDEENSLIVSPEGNVNTVGFRLLPRLSDSLTGNAELAYQFGRCGDNDVGAFGSDLTLTYQVPVAVRAKPSATVGLCYLSGDDPATPDNEGWTQPWARWPQYNEIYNATAILPSRWSNLMMPYLTLACAPREGLKICATIASLSAPQDEADRTDKTGDGNRKGLLGSIRTDFVLAKHVVRESDKLYGHLMAEVMKTGDYYSDQDSNAVFVRWELSYAF